MAGPNSILVAAAEAYFTELRRVRASGGATGERSYYPALAGLLGKVGATLKPRVFCVLELADQGAGHPDGALYTARQVQKGRPKPGQVPERGVVEVKGVGDDAWVTAASDQVSRYWDRYRLVLVTNLREFVLVGTDGMDGPANLETFRLADDAGDFWRKVETPRVFAREVGAGLGEYLARALSHRAALAEPKDLAWLLASYARDGLARVEAAVSVPSLLAVRSAMEEALGIRFEGARGERLFRSTLIQTLFYGVFSAWVLWSRDEQKKHGPLFEGHYSPQRRFRWREAVWHLRAPVLRALFQQLADPGRLKPLGLVEVLDWTSAALDRVDRAAFFSRFNEGEAVPYFYEPFLEAFDPVLRKQLGVWYTPTEVVRYMVARVDKALRNDLGIPKGLAAENVYVLDPCCGTGAYLAEVLRRIATNLGEQGLGALAGGEIRRAATERVFGFEIMPAPFVVAHLQVGLTMQNLGAPLAEDGSERAGVFLTNALTGWEPQTNKPIPFPELEEERDLAESVKQDIPILVILGNPPYNGFAGMAVDEERELSEAYRTVKDVRRPEGQGLNDLYVRFFRMAERRIAKETGQRRDLLHLQLLVARRPVLHGDAGALPQCVRRDPDRLSERRQVQDRQGRAGRIAGPEHLLHGGRSGRNPGGHGHRHAGAQGGPRTRRSHRVPALVGAGQARGAGRHGGRGTGRAVFRDRTLVALGPSVRGDRSESRMVRLARASRPVPGFVSGCSDQTRLVLDRCRPRSSEATGHRLL